MQDNSKEKQEESPELLDLLPEDKRNLVGFFDLLIKVDKRINPTLYQLNTSQKDD